MRRSYCRQNNYFTRKLCVLRGFISYLKLITRNSPTGFYVFPVPDEHTNWRDEQFAWHNTAVLFDQSYHMTDVYIKGPDRIRLLSDMSINNYENFGPVKAAQCGALAKVNPPIRPRADVEYLWEMLLDGKLDWVVSDHACCRPGSG